MNHVRPLILAATIAAFSFSASAQNKQPALPWDAMDLGPFHTATFKIPRQDNQVTAKGIAIKVGSKDSPATILFDPELLRVSAAWTGGFVEIPNGRGGLEGQTNLSGQWAFGTNYAPGWVMGPMVEDPRDRHQGHLPNDVAKYRGLFQNAAEVVLNYTVGKAMVMELPGTDFRGGKRVFTRTISAGPFEAESTMLLADVANGKGSVDADGVAVVESGDTVTAVAVLGLPKAKLEVAANGRVTLKVPAIADAAFQIAIWSGPKAELPKSADLLKSSRELPDPLTEALPGPAIWGEALETKGKLGTGDEAYVLDEITLPDPNPYNSWLRLGGHDFFPNGDAAVVNVSGDVWIVSRLDDTLEHVKWKRFATGLFQPLGCKVVDGLVYVLGRDQITRLRDADGNGEADHYECFNNDCVVTENYHEFALDLQTDASGRFYYAKGSPWTPTNMSPSQGTLLRVTQDGSKMEKICDGLRAPNGLGMGPKDFLTCSDNQGHWMPANRLNVIKHGGFYGMTPAAHRVLHFKAADGTEFDANPSSAEDRAKFKTEFWGDAKAPTPTAGYDLPLVWMPQSVDNSPGGEVWVSGGKWGPWEGRMLHLSYGHCRLYGVAMETVDGVMQGAVIKFPFKFPSGVMRARFSPKDGQFYATGLNVWQSDASKFGCFSRVRYTGKPVAMVSEVHALKDGVQLKFTAPVDEKGATDAQNFSIERWNYKWTGNYGSDNYSVSEPTKHGANTADLMVIDKITLSPDKQTLMIALPENSPTMQMKIRFKIQSADGKPVEQEIHNTIHRLPGAKVGAL